MAVGPAVPTLFLMLEQHPHLAQWEDLCVAHMLILEFQVDIGMGESGEMKLSWVCTAPMQPRPTLGVRGDSL